MYHFVQQGEIIGTGSVYVAIRYIECIVGAEVGEGDKGSKCLFQSHLT